MPINERPAVFSTPTMPRFSSVPEAIGHWAAIQPERHAITSPEFAPITYRMLNAQIRSTAYALRALGVRPADRVIVALPQGPALASTVLAVASSTIAVPLDPSASKADFERWIDAVQPTAIIVSSDAIGSFPRSARLQQIRIIELRTDPDMPESPPRIFEPDWSTFQELPLVNTEGIALLLGTSGTTGDTKFVRLTHVNVCSAGADTRDALGLSPADRCLNLASLYHAHGLIAGVLSSLMAGSTVICPSRADPDSFISWSQDFSPTWYTAVPTVHQAVLRRICLDANTELNHSLRLIRSASAYLSPSLRKELEATFGVVVVEGYGLTEAMQLTNTPRDPALRKLGSLGLVGHSEIAIMDAHGSLLPTGETGEIVARGPAVSSGYWNDAELTSASFISGWLRTGDLGHIDADGHLFLTGRIKDLINRGGDIISPQETDNVLLLHPDVEMAVSFAVPHATLGEEIVAAVVLKPGALASSPLLKDFVSKRLPWPKVPKRIYITSQMPSTRVGKPSRRQLSEQFTSPHDYRAPASPENDLQCVLLDAWKAVFQIENVGIDDDFFELGGNSILAITLFNEISAAVRRDAKLKGSVRFPIDPALLWQASTVRALAQAISISMGITPPTREVLRFNDAGSETPFIMLTGVLVGEPFYLLRFEQTLGSLQPIYGLSPFDLQRENSPRSIEEMALRYLALVRQIQPAGPYRIGGYSHSGLVAFELAKLLSDAGEQVDLLFIIDTEMPSPRLRHLRRAIKIAASFSGWSSQAQDEAFIRWEWRISNIRAQWYRGGLWGGLWPLLRSFVGRRLGSRTSPLGKASEKSPKQDEAVDPVPDVYFKIIRRYVPAGRCDGVVTLICPIGGNASWINDPTLGWGRVCRHVDVLSVDGDHATCLTLHADTVAKHLAHALRRPRQVSSG